MEKSLGRYTILEELGQGGLGKVYKAHDPQLDRIVAIKMLIAGESANEKETERFLREARATALLHHPNIVTIYDICQDKKATYFAMEFVDGVTLQTLTHKTPLSIRQAIAIMVKICEAVHYAHGQGVIHRDIKPANVMLTQNQEPKVMDFGLAKITREKKRLSLSGTIFGTLQYMPPEQAEGHVRAIDVRSDVYSLGATLYELVTAQPPFTGNSLQILYRISHDDPLSPRRLNPRVPPDLESIILKALHKNKGRRYQSAQALRDDLLNFSEGKPVVARPIGYDEKCLRWTRKHKLAICGVCLIPLLLLTIWQAMTQRRPQEKQTPFQWTVKSVNQDKHEQCLFVEGEKILLESKLQLLQPFFGQAAIEIYGPGVEYIHRGGDGNVQSRMSECAHIPLVLTKKTGPFTLKVKLSIGTASQERQIKFDVKGWLDIIRSKVRPEIWAREQPYFGKQACYNGHFYMLIRRQAGWLEAQKACEELGGHLVTITSKEENDAAFTTVEAGSIVWIGLKKDKRTQKFLWITGEDTEKFQNWCPGEPNNMRGREDSGEMYYGDQWNDNYYMAQNPFLCEWEP